MSTATRASTGRGATRSAARLGQPAAPTGVEAIYRRLFESFDRDKHDRVSHWEVLSRQPRRGRAQLSTRFLRLPSTMGK
jgi:hypothetical protein